VSGADSLASLDQVQTGSTPPRVKSDLAVSRSYVDLRTDPAAEQRGAEALGATMVSGPIDATNALSITH
jgi:hypothetical protein